MSRGGVYFGAAGGRVKCSEITAFFVKKVFDRRARGCYNNQAASKRQDKLRTGARLQSETTKKVGAIHYAGYYRYRR